LPRDAANVPALRSAARRYTRLDIDVGSPDSFHDVFMARQLLSRVLYHSRPEQLGQDTVAYDFMQVVLGDAVIIEDVEVQRLFADALPGLMPANWLQVYREALQRGWMLTAYLLPDSEPGSRDLFGTLDTMFPLGGHDIGSRMHLMGGAPAEAMDAPLHAASLLFCRRGVLRDTPEAATNTPITSATSNVSDTPAELSESVLAALAPMASEPSAASDGINDSPVAEEGDKEGKDKDVAKDSGGSADKQEGDLIADPAVSDSGMDIAPEKEAQEQGVMPEAEVNELLDGAPQTEEVQATEEKKQVEEMPSHKTSETPVAEYQDRTLIQDCTLTEIAKEGEVMQSSVWPQMADKQLLRVLKKQVEGALELLNSSTEDGLIKLTDAMDRDVEGVLADDIMSALTDFQNVDRVMQRLRNVEACLNDWGDAQAEGQGGQPLWKDEVEKRYVMEEERQVLRSEL
ncbi:MAG: hypothetical protein Q9M23_05150, partial [Mariprofundaceae bacterium]|nr:hypothetical protein [Mariprofundaceae bacterium]